ncbi:hypothetical protein C2S51_001622 [Perilla frutescens var. frutescens]|nr:hypothetical protein C2S51_001622 [Perilla frutescens var. frutescens]
MENAADRGENRLLKAALEAKMKSDERETAAVKRLAWTSRRRPAEEVEREMTRRDPYWEV